MQFIDYLSDSDHVYTKEECPNDCEFKNNHKIPIVAIAPPQSSKKIIGIIISRDPTTRFIESYLSARSGTLITWNKTLMTVQAPPQWLISKIKSFDKNYLKNANNINISNFERLLENNFYWTHLHKCCTDKLEKDLGAVKFKDRNAKLCANTWLKSEIKDVKSSGARIMICLGKDVEEFIKPMETDISSPDLSIFYLPHPSNANNAKWYPKKANEREKLADDLVCLFKACNNIN